MAVSRIAPAEGGASRPTRIEVACTNGRARITALANGEFLAAKPLRVTDACARIALVGITMALLAGDTLELRVRVGEGITLEIVEPTGLVAYDAEGLGAIWHADFALAEGATLIWHGAPFVAAKGSNAHRLTELALAPGARALVRETLVLGRSGEAGIELRSETAIQHNGQPLLVEDLALDEEVGTLPGIVAPARAIATATAAGWRPQGDAGDPHRLDFAGPGALFRALTPAAHGADALIGPIFRDWRDQLLRHRAAPRKRTSPAP